MMNRVDVGVVDDGGGDRGVRGDGDGGGDLDVDGVGRDGGGGVGHVDVDGRRAGAGGVVVELQEVQVVGVGVRL